MTENNKDAKTPSATGRDGSPPLLSREECISTLQNLFTTDFVGADCNHPKNAKIGAGTCGMIFSQPDQLYVLKFAKDGWNNDLEHDFIAHSKVKSGFKRFPIADLFVPELVQHIHPTNEKWWARNSQRFHPQDLQLLRHRPCIESEHIPELPKKVRNALIDLWCPSELRNQIKADESNRHCLARVYLGGYTLPRTRPLHTFSLKNYPLRLDKLKYIWSDLTEIFHIASIMGNALAHLHWAAGNDGRDVEFVLGSCPKIYNSSGGTISKVELPRVEEMQVDLEDDRHRWRGSSVGSVRLWMLDFNQCREIKPDESGLKEAVSAYFANDPYYPRPLRTGKDETRLWEEFCAGYLSHFNKILNTSLLQKECVSDALNPIDSWIGQKFLDMVVDEERERIKRREAAEERLRENMRACLLSEEGEGSC